MTAALGSGADVTAADLAATTGLGRSTIGKALAELERAGTVRRSTGGREGGRRLPARWSLATQKSPEPQGVSERLRPGQLDGLVLDYLQEHGKSGPLGPTAVARGLGRSSGAVGNCLARLAADGGVRQVSERPRRYVVA